VAAGLLESAIQAQTLAEPRSTQKGSYQTRCTASNLSKLGIQLAPPIAEGVWLCGESVDEDHVGARMGRDRSLEEAVEQQAAVAGAAAVKAEGELVEVVVELVVADRALVGAQDPNV
jgi:hypothetical protein